MKMTMRPRPQRMYFDARVGGAVFKTDFYTRRAVDKTMYSKAFVSPSGLSSQWLIMLAEETPANMWYAMSKDFFFGQKVVQSSYSQEGIEKNIQKFVDSNTTNVGQPMFRDALGEYWILGKDNGWITDSPYAMTSAYDGLLIYSPKALASDDKPIKNAVQAWVNLQTGPIDPPKDLYGYNVGNSTTAEGPPVYTVVKADPAAGSATGDKAKDNSPFQLPTANATGPTGEPGMIEFAPKTSTTNIPWTPILVGGGALLAVTYLIKQE